jgi:hypothetical protein
LVMEDAAEEVNGGFVGALEAGSACRQALTRQAQ